MLSPQEIGTIRGSALLEVVRAELVACEARTRGDQEVLVAAGLRAAPDPDRMFLADCLHGIDRALEHSLHAGPGTTVKEITDVLREALLGAATKRQLDEAAAADQSGGARPEDQVLG